MKILVIAGWMHPDAEGGSFRAVYESALGLCRMGHQVTVLTQRLSDKMPCEEMLEGIRICRYKTFPQNSFTFLFSTLVSIAWHVMRLKKKERFDVVHAHHLFSAFGYCLAQLFVRKMPLVFNFYIAKFLEFEDEELFGQGRTKKTFRIRLLSFILRKMEGFVLHQAKRVVVYSDFTRGQIQQFFPQALVKTDVLAPGVDLTRFKPAEIGAARDHLGLERDRLIVLTVRRLEPRMGIENLIHAVQEAVCSLPKLLLVIVGRGSLEKRLKTLVHDLKLDFHIKWTGWIPDEDLICYYQAADLFVLPTRALEGFGLVTLESLACGTPVLGTPVGATPEILERLDRSFILKDETPSSIAQGIVQQSMNQSNPALSKAQCRKFVEEHFSWPEHCRKLEKIMKEIIA